MPRDLSDLPPELVEGIVCHLELRDLCNLRLTNRATEAASSQGYYKSFFTTKTIRLDHDTVTNFSTITKNCRLAVCLRDLNIVGLPKQSAAANSSWDVENVLCNTLQNLQRQPEYRGLRSVSVGIDTDACDPYYKVRFVTGASAVRITLRALNESGLSVENLNLVADISHCSVPCDVFEDLFGPAQPSLLWSRLKKLSLSLASHQRTKTSSEAGNTSAEERSDSNSTGETFAAGDHRLQALTNFFALFSNIEEFSLHWYKLRQHTQSDADFKEIRWFDEVSQAISFDNLRSLTLRGLYATQSALHRVLMAPTLQSVHLEYVHVLAETSHSSADSPIFPGPFRPLLDCLTASGRKLNYLYLDDIFEGQSKMVYFLVEEAPSLKTMRMGPGPSTIRQSGQEVTMPLDYGYVGGRALDSFQLRRYLNRRQSEFGTPTRLF